MEKNPNSNPVDPQGRNTFSADSGDVEFHVTYIDSDGGRIRTEAFETEAEAQRFASRMVLDEDGWALVDAVTVRQGRLAA
ncbi:hypothetical protein [Arthrobacter sp. 92]|jgi:hypothetical protein|uniref:hypothetical protein n=1 Tax=Arthrobacter sp. 92 TaxID=3418175 RepID=UPI003D06561C